MFSGFDREMPGEMQGRGLEIIEEKTGGGCRVGEKTPLARETDLTCLFRAFPCD